MNMFDIFGKELYETVINDIIKIYKKEYENAMSQDDTDIDSLDLFSKRKKDFYKSLKEENDIYFDILELVIINRISYVLGILGGSTSMRHCLFLDTEIKIEDEDMTCKLQDSFLAYVEETEKWGRPSTKSRA